MKNSVKFDEIITFDHKFYVKTANFPSNFVPLMGILSKNFLAFFKKIFSDPVVSAGGIWLSVTVILALQLISRTQMLYEIVTDICCYHFNCWQIFDFCRLHNLTPLKFKSNKKVEEEHWRGREQENS